MKKVHYNKLIRDRIPKVMQENGAAFSVRKLSKKVFRIELLKKVGEEASALLQEKSKRDITKELADVLDVISAIQREFKISKRDILSAQKVAMKKKGGFSKRLFLLWSQDTGYTTNERRYKK